MVIVVYVSRTKHAIYSVPEMKSIIYNANMQVMKQDIIVENGILDDNIILIYNTIDNKNLKSGDRIN